MRRPPTPLNDVLAAALVLAVILGPASLVSAQIALLDPSATTAGQDDDDLDSNLVPLEPELLVVPPDALTGDDKPQNPGDAVGQASTPAVPGDQNSDVSKAVAAATLYNIPVVIDPTVQSHIHFFNTSIRSRFEQWLVRLSRYRPLVENIFAEFNLPSDLVSSWSKAGSIRMRIQGQRPPAPGNS